jgi:hypothetical protein
VLKDHMNERNAVEVLPLALGFAAAVYVILCVVAFIVSAGRNSSRSGLFERSF